MNFSVSMSSTYDQWGCIAPIGEAARVADESGFFGIQMGDHILHSLEPGALRRGLIWYDPFVLASHLATLTKHVRIVFGVVVLPYRHPIHTARLVSTLDQISGGRVVLGVGSGWLRAEFDALGVPFDHRGAMTDEYIKAMKVLWTEDRPSFEGRYVSFGNLVFLPKCVQEPHVPLWIGGASRPAMRRAAHLGDCWCPNAGGPESLAKDIAWTKARALALGRQPDALDFSYRLHIGKRDQRMDKGRRDAHPEKYVPQKEVTEPQEIIDFVGQFQEAGINHLLIQFNWEKPADFMRQTEWFATKIMPDFAQPAER